MSEQRKFSRKLVFLKLVLVGPEGERTPGLATDLSLGGMFVGIAKQYPFGTPVTVELQLEPAMTMPATVRWNKPEGLGLQFGPLGVRETTAILDLVKAASQG